MRTLTHTDPTALAEELAGNWTRFDSFGPGEDLRSLDTKNFCLVYTHNRDSRLADQSNSAVIAKLLAPHTVTPDDAPDDYQPDAQEASCGHWAVGWVAGWILRIRKEDGSGEFTDAFQIYADCQHKMENIYPILDESDYSDREHDATCDNVKEAVRWFANRHDIDTLPDDAWDHVMSWLYENTNNALENTDDNGGWPDDDDLEDAFLALGYMTRSDTTPE
jgi:hypothetical protein